MNAEFNRKPLKHRVAFLTLALIASTSTIALTILAPLATHGGLV